jgi:hypothetical protein
MRSDCLIFAPAQKHSWTMIATDCGSNMLRSHYIPLKCVCLCNFCLRQRKVLGFGASIEKVASSTLSDLQMTPHPLRPSRAPALEQTSRCFAIAELDS